MKYLHGILLQGTSHTIREALFQRGILWWLLQRRERSLIEVLLVLGMAGQYIMLDVHIY